MDLVLNNSHLEKINGFIQKTPFEYAYPLFQYLTSVIQEQANVAQQAAQAPVAKEEV